MVTGNARVSDLAVAKVRRFCDQRVPAEARDEVCLEVTTRAATITIVERRPLWQGGPGGWTRMSIAQLRYDTAAGTWTCTGRTATDAGTATTTSTQPPSSTTSSRRSTRTPSPCSGDSAAPTGIAARDQLVRLPQRCLQTPSITVAMARFGSISVRLWWARPPRHRPPTTPSQRGNGPLAIRVAPAAAGRLWRGVAAGLEMSLLPGGSKAAARCRAARHRPTVVSVKRQRKRTP